MGRSEVELEIAAGRGSNCAPDAIAGCYARDNGQACCPKQARASQGTSWAAPTTLAVLLRGSSLADQTYCAVRQTYLQQKQNLVEAAGVEPASENVTGQEPTCVVQFMPQALPWDVRGARSERTRNANH